MRRILRPFWQLTLRLIAALALIAPSYAHTPGLLHTFVSSRHGANPQWGLVADAAGNLYGTTFNGGMYGLGTVFELTRELNGQWKQIVLHSFAGSSDGELPTAPLMVDSAGNVYGTTSAGGIAGAGKGFGTVFQLTPGVNGKWTETILHTFSGAPDGQDSQGRLTMDAAGNLYGTTYGGGKGAQGSGGCNDLCGVVFELTPSQGMVWTEQVIYTFTGESGGSNPIGDLVFDKSGRLYGTAKYGGISGCEFGCGAIFQLAPSGSGAWTLNSFYDFSPSYGDEPVGIALDAAGNIFGILSSGGGDTPGIVYELVNNGNGWDAKTLYTFTGGTDGASPTGGVALDASGNLYGTTQAGGQSTKYCSFGCGVIFELSPGENGVWTESVPHAFAGGAEGFAPNGPIAIDPVGNLYAATYCNAYISPIGCRGNGTVVSLTPSQSGWTFSRVYGFPNTDGAGSESTLVSDGAGRFYGTTTAGGEDCYGGAPNGCGTVFKMVRSPQGVWERKIIYSFTGKADGAGPMGGLVFDQAGNLYGATAWGGNDQCIHPSVPSIGCGTVFELSPSGNDTWTETVLYRFKSLADGFTAVGSLVFDSAGNLYGATSEGGSGTCYLGCGTVYLLSPRRDGHWQHTILYSFQFDGVDGDVPMAGLILDSAGNLYGTTSRGGAQGNGSGTIYELSGTANGPWRENILHTFLGTEGASPKGSLVFDQAGNLYGTAEGGGSCPLGNLGCGTVFKLTPAQGAGAGTLSVLYDFQGPPGDGFHPIAGVIFDPAGNLYGTTAGGGNATDDQCYEGCGTVFRLTPKQDGTWDETVLHSLDGFVQGAYPVGNLVFGESGNLFGTTSEGGLAGGGTVFELQP